MSRLLHQLESEVMALQPASSQTRCLKLLHSARQSLQVRVRPPHRRRTCAECWVAPRRWTGTTWRCPDGCTAGPRWSNPSAGPRSGRSSLAWIMYYGTSAVDVDARPVLALWLPAALSANVTVPVYRAATPSDARQRRSQWIKHGRGRPVRPVTDVDTDPTMRSLTTTSSHALARLASDDALQGSHAASATREGRVLCARPT